MKNTHKIFLLILLAVILFFVGQMKPEQKEREKKVSKEVLNLKEQEKKAPKRYSKQRISNLQNEAEDNINLPLTNWELEFTGYDKEKLSWLSEEDYARLQEQLKGYLKKKELEDVTRVTLHSDSVQKINPYEWYLYLDVDYQTESANTLLLKAVCDTYQDTLRFAFQIQYGPEENPE